jgi:uncharacterized protein
MKIVLDTNVLINGFKDEYSYEKRIIDAVIAGEIEAYANKQTFRENKLLSRQVVDSGEYDAEMDKFFSQLNMVENRRQIHIVRDPEDNKILESAVEAGAEYLVTSDNDLLMLDEFQEVKIINPAQFWVKYKDEGMDLWKQWTNFITKK